MNDSEMNMKIGTDHLEKEKESTALALKNLAVDLEEELYSVKIQLKSKNNLLKEKEQEFEEYEKTKVYNYDLFSTIKSKSVDSPELITLIAQLKVQIEELNNKQNNLVNKVESLKNAVKLINHVSENSNNIYIPDKQQGFNERSLGILEAQEIERQRISRDLHDTTVQNLTSMVHKAELCVKLIDIDTIRAKLELNSMSSTIKTVINDMRGIIYNLKPMTLDDLGLAVTVRRYANKLMDLHNIQVKVQSKEDKDELLPVIRLTLFRVIQEACNNIIKHANATLIILDIQYEDNYVKVVIEDNGSGFEKEKIQPVSANQTANFGLSIMRERTSLLSGTLDIQTEKGKGTKVIVSIPLIYCEEEENE